MHFDLGFDIDIDLDNRTEWMPRGDKMIYFLAERYYNSYDIVSPEIRNQVRDIRTKKTTDFHFRQSFTFGCERKTSVPLCYVINVLRNYITIYYIYTDVSDVPNVQYVNSKSTAQFMQFRHQLSQHHSAL